MSQCLFQNIPTLELVAQLLLKRGNLCCFRRLSFQHRIATVSVVYSRPVWWQAVSCPLPRRFPSELPRACPRSTALVDLAHGGPASPLRCLPASFPLLCWHNSALPDTYSDGPAPATAATR